METVKKLKKHDHTLTDIIKAFIFFIVLLAPILAVLTKCLYVSCNKNANLSYSGYENGNVTLDYVTSNTQIVIGDEYYFTNGAVTTPHAEVGTRTQRIFYNNVQVIENSTSYDLANTYAVGFYTISNSANMYYYFYYDNEQYFQLSSNNAFTIKFNITQDSTGNTNPFTICNCLYKKDVNPNYQLDKAFYYAVDEMKDSTLFGWTKNTAIYTGVNAMCSGLAVQDGALPVLITYWTLTTAIYIILDIVIFAFKKITHFLQ